LIFFKDNLFFSFLDPIPYSFLSRSKKFKNYYFSSDPSNNELLYLPLPRKVVDWCWYGSREEGRVRGEEDDRNWANNQGFVWQNLFFRQLYRLMQKKQLKGVRMFAIK
jgi:hypothetical protein